MVDGTTFATVGEPLGPGAIYIDLLAEGLAELADRSVQEKLWLGHDPGRMGSFEEAVAQVFDDSGAGLVLDREDSATRLGPPLDAALRRLSAAVGRINALVPPSDLIAGSGMDLVRERAAKAIELVNDIRLRGLSSQ